MTTSGIRTSQQGRTTAIRLAVFLLGTGISHFVAPKQFDAMVPDELPGDARLYTYVSGVGELATSAMLAVPRTRRRGGLAAAALFLAVLPANVHTLRVWWSRSWSWRALGIARLPLQIPLIMTAFRVWRTVPA